MAAHHIHPEPVLRTTAALALADLLIRYPDLSPERSGLTWTLTPAGTLRAEATGAQDGRALDLCAEIMHATPLRAHVTAGPDRVVLAELAGIWQGVPVVVWETYFDTATRRLGTLVPVTEAHRG